MAGDGGSAAESGRSATRPAQGTTGAARWAVRRSDVGRFSSEPGRIRGLARGRESETAASKSRRSGPRRAAVHVSAAAGQVPRWQVLRSSWPGQGCPGPRARRGGGQCDMNWPRLGKRANGAGCDKVWPQTRSTAAQATGRRANVPTRYERHMPRLANPQGSPQGSGRPPLPRSREHQQMAARASAVVRRRKSLERQQAMLQLHQRGKTSAEIAATLGMSPRQTCRLLSQALGGYRASRSRQLWVVPCPTCGAPAGKGCTTSGGHRSAPHKARPDGRR